MSEIDQQPNNSPELVLIGTTEISLGERLPIPRYWGKEFAGKAHDVINLDATVLTASLDLTRIDLRGSLQIPIPSQIGQLVLGQMNPDPYFNYYTTGTSYSKGIPYMNDSEVIGQIVHPKYKHFLPTVLRIENYRQPHSSEGVAAEQVRFMAMYDSQIMMRDNGDSDMLAIARPVNLAQPNLLTAKFGGGEIQRRVMLARDKVFGGDFLYLQSLFLHPSGRDSILVSWGFPRPKPEDYIDCPINKLAATIDLLYGSPSPILYANERYSPLAPTLTL